MIYSKNPNGFARFSRVSGRKKLFNSQIEHDNFISLTIGRGEMLSSFGEKRLHTQEEIIEVYMTNVQFAELITSLNYGSGVPVTLNHLNNEKMDQVAFEKSDMDETRQYTEEGLKKELDRLNQEFKKFSEIIQDSKLSIKDKSSINNGLRALSNISSNFNFFENRLKETSEKYVQNVKQEIEAHIEHKMNTIAEKAILKSERFKTLTDSINNVTLSIPAKDFFITDSELKLSSDLVEAKYETLIEMLTGDTKADLVDLNKTVGDMMIEANVHVKAGIHEIPVVLTEFNKDQENTKDSVPLNNTVNGTSGWIELGKK